MAWGGCLDRSENVFVDYGKFDLAPNPGHHKADMLNETDSQTDATAVTIFGREYVLHSTEAPDYTREIARIVDEKMSVMATDQKLADPTKIAIMAAMEIADELLRKREARSSSADRVNKAMCKLGQVLDQTGSDG